MSVHITSRAWKTKGLSMTQKIVLVKLADNASDQGQCWPSVPTIAKECSCTERAVYSAIKELERLGHITRRIRSGNSTVYTVNPCTTFTPETDSPLNDIHPTPEPVSPPPLNVVHTTPERRSPKPSRTVNRTIKEPSESLPLPFASEVKTAKPKKEKMTDEHFMQSLKANPAYKGIDIDNQINKMRAWLLTKPNRKLTRPFIVGWLNRIDQPMEIQPANTPRCHPGEMTPKKKPLPMAYGIDPTQ